MPSCIQVKVHHAPFPDYLFSHVGGEVAGSMGTRLQFEPLQILISESLRQSELTNFPSSTLVEAYDFGIRTPVYPFMKTLLGLRLMTTEYQSLLCMRYGYESHYVSEVLKPSSVLWIISERT